jgi:hypothetical protein
VNVKAQRFDIAQSVGGQGFSASQPRKGLSGRASGVMSRNPVDIPNFHIYLTSHKSPCVNTANLN